MIESWTTQVLQTASKQVVTLAARTDKKAYREHKEKGYRDELRRLQEERRHNAQSDGRESVEDKVAPPSEAHVKACLDLMRKTKDPKLFAALIREGVPADRFCVDALSGALPAILQKFGVDVSKIPIRIESSDDRFSHDSSTTDDPNAVVIKVERTVEVQSVGHFYSPDGNCDSNVKSEGRYDCMFDCLAQQIKEKYNVELNSRVKSAGSRPRALCVRSLPRWSRLINPYHRRFATDGISIRSTRDFTVVPNCIEALKTHTDELVAMGTSKIFRKNV